MNYLRFFLVLNFLCFCVVAMEPATTLPWIADQQREKLRTVEKTIAPRALDLYAQLLCYCDLKKQPNAKLESLALNYLSRARDLTDKERVDLMDLNELVECDVLEEVIRQLASDSCNRRDPVDPRSLIDVKQ
jgi:hypothetical protein